MGYLKNNLFISQTINKSIKKKKISSKTTTIVPLVSTVPNILRNFVQLTQLITDNLQVMGYSKNTLFYTKNH